MPNIWCKNACSKFVRGMVVQASEALSPAELNTRRTALTLHIRTHIPIRNLIIYVLLPALTFFTYKFETPCIYFTWGIWSIPGHSGCLCSKTLNFNTVGYIINFIMCYVLHLNLMLSYYNLNAIIASVRKESALLSIIWNLQVNKVITCCSINIEVESWMWKFNFLSFFMDILLFSCPNKIDIKNTYFVNIIGNLILHLKKKHFHECFILWYEKKSDSISKSNL